MVKEITSKSQLKKGQKFNLNLFKEPFCSNEKDAFKRYETVNFKENFFLQKSKKFNNNGKILFISGPARNGNHIVMSMLDNHPQIIKQPGEDFLLREFICRAKENEIKIINKIKSLKKIDYIMNMSGVYMNKWKKLYEAWKKNKKIKTWSGQQQINKSHITDFQDFVPKINYIAYKNHLKKNLKQIKNSNTFLDFLLIYLQALSKLCPQKKNVKYKYLYVYSGLRRELFYLLEKTTNIVCICPIRRFETFYFSYAKSRFKTNEIEQKALNELWEHWRHKTIDYLLLKKKYPKKVFFVKFEDLINDSDRVSKKICSILKIKYSKNLKKATILGRPVKGNSSFAKSNSVRGKFYKDPIKKKFPSKILPEEYFDILKKVSVQTI